MGTRTDTCVSVVIPVYNDPAGLRTTLDALVDQGYPAADHEILVVDNNSTDETHAVATEFSDRYDHIGTLVEADVQSSYAARNTGIEHADGSVIAFVDADMTVPADWLTDAVAAFERTEAAYMGCNVELYTPAEEASLPAKFNRLSGFPIEQYIEQRQFAPTCCLVVARSVFDDVGRFDETLISSGDREFGHRVADAGYSQHYAADVTMYHPTRTSLDELVDKAVRIGRGTYQLRTRYPERYGSPRDLLLNPVTYFPPIPWRLDEAIQDWTSLPLSERVGFYALATVASYSRTYGKVREALR
jgi:glycosyltransferase involved in cell wall biosynthesis